ncbi:MAG TPA: serine/threonine-protein kinase, partial [Polyangia bacterium]
GIIHRDLKPANLFIVPLAGSSRFLVKILDFGISKAADGANALTKTQTVIGTPNYMAPEQAIAASTSLDARADQFALAAIAYELVTGRKAFDGPHVLAVLYSVVNDRPPTFASLGLALGAEIEAVIARGLEKPAADRYPSVLDFSRAFRAAIGAAPAANEASAPAATLVLPALDQVVQGGKAATTARPTNPPPASSSSHATDQPSASGRTLGRRWLIAAVAIIALSALAIALALSGRDQEGPAASNPATPATPPAKATAPAESTKPSETAPEPAAPALAPSAPPPQPKPAPPDEATESPPKSTRSEKIRPTTKPKRPKVPLNESL